MHTHTPCGQSREGKSTTTKSIMIANKLCPYCGVELQPNKRRSTNRTDDSKDKEHFIPRTLYRKKSGIDPDFYACHKCNSKIKGKLDYIIGWISKASSCDSSLAVDAVKKAITDKQHNNKRAIAAILSAKKEKEDFFSLDLPLSGKEIISYGKLLTKGQYFKDTQQIVNLSNKIIKVDFLSPALLHFLDKEYYKNHQADYYTDLMQNSNSIVPEEGEFIIFRSNDQYLFFFHKFFGFMTEVKNNTCKNRSKFKKHERQLCKKLNRNS